MTVRMQLTTTCRARRRRSRTRAEPPPSPAQPRKAWRLTRASVVRPWQRRVGATRPCASDAPTAVRRGACRVAARAEARGSSRTVRRESDKRPIEVWCHSQRWFLESPFPNVVGARTVLHGMTSRATWARPEFVHASEAPQFEVGVKGGPAPVHQNVDAFAAFAKARAFGADEQNTFREDMLMFTRGLRIESGRGHGSHACRPRDEVVPE